MRKASAKKPETINYGTSIWGEAFKRLLRNKAAIIGGIIFLSIVLVAVFADLIAPYGYEEQSLKETFLPPFSPNHPFGTDNVVPVRWCCLRCHGTGGWHDHRHSGRLLRR